MISKCKNSLKSLVNNKIIKINRLKIFHRYPKNRNNMNKIRTSIKYSKNNHIFLLKNIINQWFNQSKRIK